MTNHVFYSALDNTIWIDTQLYYEFYNMHLEWAWFGEHIVYLGEL